MNQCGTLQPCRPWVMDCAIMTVSMQISTMMQCTLTEHSSHVLKAEYFTTYGVLQIFSLFSLQGLLLNSGVILQSSRCHKHQNKKEIKVRQGWLFFSLLFFHCLPFGALCPSLSSRAQIQPV